MNLGTPMPKGTMVTIRTDNGGEITAPLALAYRPTYCATLDIHGRAVVILATRIVSIVAEEGAEDPPYDYPFCARRPCPFWRGYCRRDPACDN